MPGMVPEDVYELTAVSDPRLSPDRKLVAFVVTRVDPEESEYRSAIWVVPTDGTESPRQLTSSDKADAAPRFSPDGTRVAFTSNRDGEKKQLYVLVLEGGEPQQLTDLSEDVVDPVWSPDSARLVFASRVPDAAYEEENEKRRLPRRFTRLQFKLDNEGWTGDRRRHLFVVPADGSAEATQLTSGDFEDSHPSWSPDGEIVFVSSRGEDWDLEPVSHLFTVSPDGGEPKQLTSGENAYNLPAWSPDGRAIACRWREAAFDWPRHERVAVVDPETGEHRSLTESLDRHTDSYPPLREPSWDGDDLVFGVEDGGNVHLYRVPADGSGPPEPAVGGDRWISGWDAAAGELVYTASTATSLPELYRGEEPLTSFGASFAEAREIVQPERFTATSKDGTEVEAWIVRPVELEEGKRYPVILSIHGGPFTQYGNKFFDEFQVYAAAGYVVLYSNPRGSSGYSEEWGRAIRGPVEGGPGWGSVDYEDLMAVVDEALGRYEFCDPDRLGVTGGSYGGYMTSWIVGHTDRFRAACSERAVNSMVSQYGSSDIGHFIRSYTGAYLFQDFDAYVRLSPIAYAENITTPMLILHSENDLRCNIEQAEQLYTTLRLLRRDVELVRFPGEGHELTRSGSPAHRVQRFEILLDWFGSRLQAAN